jgi:hypothetical protein
MARIRISSSATRERVLREAAAQEAAELFSRHGSDAVTLLSDRLTDQSRSAEERRADRLALLEVERLDRRRRQSSSPQALVVWKPPVLSKAWFANLFGIKPGLRRRR